MADEPNKPNRPIRPRQGAPGRKRRVVIEGGTNRTSGLAVQDLAITLAALKRAEELDLPTIDL